WEFWRPFSPTASPLFGFYLARVAADRYLWLQKYHHLVIDATGRQIVVKDVADIYNALASRGEIPAAEVTSFADAVEGDGAYIGSEQYAVDRAYWSRRFAEPVWPLLDRANRVAEKTASGRATRV